MLLAIRFVKISDIFFFLKESLCEGIDFDSPEETGDCVRFWVKTGAPVVMAQTVSLETMAWFMLRGTKSNNSWLHIHFLVPTVPTSPFNIICGVEASIWKPYQ